MRAWRCSSPWYSTAWTAASRAGPTPKARSARNTTACPTWCPSASRPAIVTYQWGVARIAEYGPLWRRLGWLVCFFYAAAAALRLARFNSRAATQDKHYFEGLPSPSAAAIVAALIWLASDRVNIGLPGLILAFLVTACAGALMISRFAFYSFKHVDAGARVRFTQIVLVPLAFVFIFLYPAITLLLIFGSYALSAPTVWIYRKLFAGARATRPPPYESGAARSEYLAAMGLEPWALRSRRARRHVGRRCRPAATVARPRRGRRIVSAGGTRVGGAAREQARLGAVARASRRLHALRAQHDAHPDRVRRRQPAGRLAHRRRSARAPRKIGSGEPFVGPRRAAAQLHAARRRTRPRAGLHRQCAEVPAAAATAIRAATRAVECLPYLERQIALLKPQDHARGRPHRGAKPAAHRYAPGAPAPAGAFVRRLARYRWS